ncbi:HORMA domain-containing protein [Xylaria palmicola]|nr:HORMA domain-containing protein [Xylaria palmicola]
MPPQPVLGPSLTIPQATRLLTTFTHFLTVCVHNILYYRGLYPATTFLTSRAYNLPVHQSRHPAVCAWVRDAVDAVRAQIAEGAVERLAVVVYDGTGAVMERWMFDVARFPAWEGVPLDGEDKEKARDRDDNNNNNDNDSHNENDDDDDDDNDDEDDDDDDDDDDSNEDDDQDAGGGAAPATAGVGLRDKVNWTDVDEQLRAAVQRLAYAGEKMAPLPAGCTFTVAVELREEAGAPIGHPQPWVPSQPNLQPPSKDRQTPGRDVGGARTTPLRAVEAGPLFFECWVEESKAKLERSSALAPSNGQ